MKVIHLFLILRHYNIIIIHFRIIKSHLETIGAIKMNNLNMEAIMKTLGDSALIVQFGEGIHPTIHQKIRRLSAMLEEDSFTGFIESVPAYNNLLIYYNPYVVHQSHRMNQSKIGRAHV